MSMRQSYRVGPDTAVIGAAVEPGVTLFDTAEVYGLLINAEMVGEMRR